MIKGFQGQVFIILRLKPQFQPVVHDGNSFYICNNGRVVIGQTLPRLHGHRMHIINQICSGYNLKLYF